MATLPTIQDLLAPYRLVDPGAVHTPALLVYPEAVRHNVRTTVALLGGDAGRWRPHVKTAKLGAVMRMLVDEGVTCVKCATTLELRTAAEAGASDVLLAYSAVGVRAARTLELAGLHPNVRVSALVEHQGQVAAWRDGRVDLFIDVDPGMNRTGICDARVDDIVRLARAVRAQGVAFRGLHYYDGHLAGMPPSEAETTAHSGYRRLLALVSALEAAGTPVEEVVTAGTPAFPWSLSFEAFAGAPFRHRVSPGTLVYGDATSARQLPARLGYRSAVLVLATVVSRPLPARVTCDAGHKAVSADAGVPTCEVVGRPDLTPLAPSEEHLPIDVAPDGAPPELGDTLYLRPRHVCPTVNNFDHAIFVREGRVAAVERVTARGREHPLRAVEGES